MIWGLIASRKIAMVNSSSEGFADKASVLVDNTEIDLDPSDGRIGIDREFYYGKKAKASGSITYSTDTMVKAWRSDDSKLKLSIAAIILGLVGIFLFLGFAVISNGGNQTYIGIGIIIFGLFALRPLFNGLRKAAR